MDRYRGRGSGGQRKNKVSTAIRLTHLPTGIVVTRETGRSQRANLVDAQRDLERQLAERSHRRASAARDRVRNEQIDREQAKGFTHNHQRGIVKDHSTGRQWSLKRWAQGRMTPAR